MRLVTEGQEARDWVLLKRPLTTFKKTVLDCKRNPESQILEKKRNPEGSKSSYHPLPWLTVLFDDNHLLKT